MLMYGRDQHNIAKQLSLNLKKKIWEGHMQQLLRTYILEPDRGFYA